MQYVSIENSYALLVLRGIIPATLIGMSLFSFGDLLNKSLGLLEVKVISYKEDKSLAN